MRFIVTGGASTVFYVSLYAGCRLLMTTVVANLLALVVTALLNTEANRRWTFTESRTSRGAQHRRAGIIFVVYYSVTTGAVLAWHTWGYPGLPGSEAVVLLGACAAMTVVRFLALDRWAFAS